MRMKFRKNRNINNSWTTRALFRVNGVSIDYLEMDYKRWLCLSLSCTLEVQGLLDAFKLPTMVKLIGD